MKDIEDISSLTDVVVIGGGPAGTATAIELASRGFAVTILERSDYQNPRIGETLPPAIVTHLARLGVWQAFLDQGHLSSYTVRSAWGTDVLHDIPHLLNPYGKGWHVDRGNFDQLLIKRALDLGVKVHTSARLVGIEKDKKSEWRLQFSKADDLNIIHSRFLVDATGRNFKLGRKLGADYKVDDNLIGVAVWFDRETPVLLPDDSYALIESGEREWWYTAPLPNGKRIAMLMTDLDLYQKGKRYSLNYWQERLEETHYTRARMKSLHPIAPARSYIAYSHQAVTLGCSGWLPVGDAMYGVDPLSGQGVYNALGMAEMAAVAIKEHFEAKSGARSNYMAQIKDAFAPYLDMRQYYYSKETRWPNSEFWRRRSALTNILR